MPRVHPLVRLRTFTEVGCGYSEWQAVAEANRCTNCADSPCRDGCPLGVDLPTFVAQVADGDFDAAFQTLTADNLLAGTCSRVCRAERSCEGRCDMVDAQPVAISRLERFIADWAAARGRRPVAATRRPRTGHHVAVVGAGPAGLTAAVDLVRFGHSVTVFEAQPEPGGSLTALVPEFRLPRAVVQREINAVKELGIHFRMEEVIGTTKTLDDLFTRDNYEAVFVATGADQPELADIPGTNLSGVYSAREYLAAARFIAANGLTDAETPARRGKRVAVIGGGDTALDVARTAVRLGAERVWLVYRRSRAEMRARAEDAAYAAEEGVRMVFLASPIAVVGDEHGRVRSMKLQEMRLGDRDSSGRRSPMPIAGASLSLDVDVVVFATGGRGRLTADAATGATAAKGVFVGGHVVDADASMAEAMAAGRRAARAINRYLGDPLPDGSA